jgi:uncharacterized damage-inducible protein DinB
VAEPTTPLPTDEAPATDERTTLIAFLDYLRVVLARKVEGVTDEQARRAACSPSDLTLLGLVRHMADVERNWFRRSFVNEAAPPLFYGASHPDGDEDGDFHAPAEATIADALAAYWSEIEVANRNIAAASLDDIEQRERNTYSLRWILIHMVEEYARHCGHADLLRQAIDGVTGD